MKVNFIAVFHLQPSTIYTVSVISSERESTLLNLYKRTNNIHSNVKMSYKFSEYKAFYRNINTKFLSEACFVYINTLFFVFL